jgi:hypothetical protein
MGPCLLPCHLEIFIDVAKQMEALTLAKGCAQCEDGGIPK